ncbi:MAG TPA: transcription-repair coupling factor, partial [Actinomycetota bacterium]|nr:transcription-repair coupling factor [Actinomycetota bacterium]
MRLDPLLDRWPADPAFAELLDALADKEAGVEVVVPDVARAFLLAGLARGAGRLVVVTTATTADAEALAEDVAAFLGPERVACFPAWETLPHERLSPRSETVARRLALLHQLGPEGSGEPRGGAPVDREGSGEPRGGAPVDREGSGGLELLTVPARAMMQPLAPGLDRVVPVRVARGDRVELEDLL